MKVSQKLKNVADELKKQSELMAIEVREGAHQSQQGTENVLNAIHKMHNFLLSVPDKLSDFAEELKRKGE